jgi:hypothetical protein
MCCEVVAKRILIVYSRLLTFAEKILYLSEKFPDACHIFADELHNEPTGGCISS